MHSLSRLQKIQTPRLLIRPIQLGDEHMIHPLIVHSSALLKQWMPWAQTISFDSTCAFVKHVVAAWQSGSAIDHPMVMIRQADQAVIGVTGYTSQNGYNDVHQGHYEIGYWCDTNYQGKGYVTECVNALTRYAFECLGASKVMIVMQVDNQKSQAVAERLGFAYQGQKDRSPTECLPGQLPKSHVYSVENSEHLPTLSYSWVDYADDDSLPK